MARLERDFIESCVAQLRYDYATLRQWFGREVPVIALGHTVPFFAEVADALFERLLTEGVVFVSLEEAVSDHAYDEVGRIVSNKFLVYQQKLADAASQPIPIIAPDIQEVHEDVLLKAAGTLR